MKNKKLSFWLLAAFFGAFTLMLVLSQPEGAAHGANMTMGAMMKSHFSGLTPQALLQAWQAEPSMSTGQAHHDITGIVETLALISTMFLYISIPVLLGGAVLMLVLWL